MAVQRNEAWDSSRVPEPRRGDGGSDVPCSRSLRPLQFDDEADWIDSLR